MHGSKILCSVNWICCLVNAKNKSSKTSTSCRIFEMEKLWKGNLQFFVDKILLQWRTANKISTAKVDRSIEIARTFLQCQTLLPVHKLMAIFSAENYRFPRPKLSWQKNIEEVLFSSAFSKCSILRRVMFLVWVM